MPAALAYLSTSLVVLAIVFALGRQGNADLLREVLGVYFIAGLAAGLEPATAKAAALRAPYGGADWPPRRAILAASAVKGLLISPAIALVWRASDPTVPGVLLGLTPLICMAGFAATDLRVVLDLEGRHAAAVWLKQGSLGGGLALLAVLAWQGVPLVWAVGVATVARLALVLVVSRPGRAESRGLSWPLVGGLLLDPGWFVLGAASVVGAVGGSADRAAGLRYLSPEAWAGYYALYEVFSKFWFIPYVIAPILFARTVAGRDARPVARWAFQVTALSGALFVGGVALALLFAPALPAMLLGSQRAAYTPNGAIVAFAAAVAVNGLAQIRIVELQAKGAARGALFALGAGAVATTALFLFAARAFGAPGLLYAWLGKSIVDLGLSYAPIWRPARAGP